MTLHNLIILLGLLGTRAQDEKDIRYRGPLSPSVSVSLAPSLALSRSLSPSLPLSLSVYIVCVHMMYSFKSCMWVCVCVHMIYSM